MTLSKREKFIGIFTVIVVAVPVLFSYVISPLTTRKAVLDAEIQAAQDELERTGRLFNTARSARREFASMAGSALHQDRASAEGQILNNVREWAQEAGVNLSSLKPEREEKEKDFQKITFRATCSGGMSQVGRFLHRIQTAAIPVRVTDLSLSSHRDGADDLSLSVALATIYQLPAEKNGARSSGSPAAREVTP
jgi:hypothetical protein